MKKFFWIISLLVLLVAHSLPVLLHYLFYFLWNFRFPKKNLWEYYHTYEIDFEGTVVYDYNPYQTFIRWYNYNFY